MTGNLSPDQAQPEKPLSLPDESARCRACGATIAALDRHCPQCGAELPPVDHVYDTPSTIPMKRVPRTVAVEGEGRSHFKPHDVALLQFLPSGVCYKVDIRDALVLGRTTNPPPAGVLDLTELNAMAHGVSRRHCALQRRGEFLVVTDLASVNGTYLNDQKLMPFVEYVVSHGDRLILGTLHLVIFFGDVDAPA